MKFVALQSKKKSLTETGWHPFLLLNDYCGFIVIKQKPKLIHWQFQMNENLAESLQLQSNIVSDLSAANVCPPLRLTDLKCITNDPPLRK